MPIEPAQMSYLHNRRIAFTWLAKVKWELEFRSFVFFGEFKIFWFKERGCPIRGFLYVEVSLFSVHFPVLKCKISKIQKFCCLFIFNIHIFLVQGAVSFHPSVGTQNQSTIHLVCLEGPPNHPASKARAFCVNVNKHFSYWSKSKVILL